MRQLLLTLGRKAVRRILFVKGGTQEGILGRNAEIAKKRSPLKRSLIHHLLHHGQTVQA